MLLGFARGVLAQPSVHYLAPSSCPTQAEFVERMRARLRVDGTRVSPGVLLRVVLVARGTSTHGTVEVERGAAKTQRGVDGERCSEVVEALALIAALALREHEAPARAHKTDKRPARAPVAGGPDSETEPGERARSADARDRDRAESRAIARAAQSGEPAAQSSAPAAQSGTPAAQSGTPAAQSGTPAAQSGATAAQSGPAPAQRGAAPAQRGAAPAQRGTTAGAPPSTPVRERSVSEDRPEPGDWRFGARIAAGFMLFEGLAPALQPGLQLQAAGALASDGFEWSLQLEGRVANAETVANKNGDARFRFLGGALRACGATTLGTRRVLLGGCAVAEPGMFSVAGENTLNGRSRSRLWLAVGAAAELGVGLASWLRLRGGAELLAPVRRDRVLLGGATVYHIPVLGLRLHLGFEIPFG